MKEYQRQWHLKNIDKVHKRHKLYRDNNKEQINEHGKEYYQKIKEKLKEKNKKKYKENKCKILERNKKYRDAHKEESKLYYMNRKCDKEATKRSTKTAYKYTLKKKYNMSIDDYINLLKLQDNKCKICGANLSVHGPDNKAYVDHNHFTGKIRGLLCRNCNLGIGLFNDNPISLINASKYLEENDKDE